MKKAILWMLLLPVVAFSQNNDNQMLNMTELTIKPGQNSQFMDGVKKYKECYKKNNGTDQWNMWKRVQGKGNVYVLTGLMNNWADMEKPNETGEKCDYVLRDFIAPHVETSTYSISRMMPEFSRTPMEGTKLVMVSFFQVKDVTQFREVVKELTDLHRKEHGEPRGTWYDYIGGGVDSPHYMVSTPYKSYSDMDLPVENIWDMHEKINGKKKSEALKTKGRNSVDASWTYLYKLDDEMSNF